MTTSESSIIESQEEFEESTNFLELRNINIEVSKPRTTKRKQKKLKPHTKIHSSNSQPTKSSKPSQPEIIIKIEPNSDSSEIESDSTDKEDITTDKEKTMALALDPKYILKLVPNFSGNSKDLHKFISSCEFIQKTLRQQDLDQFLELIRLKLDGKAYNLMKYKTLDTWENFKKILVTEFSDTRSIGHLQMELSSLRQHKNEDVKSYANRVECLLHDLNEACIASVGAGEAETIKTLNSNIALKSFQEGLDDSVKLIVKACRFTNFSESINRAVEEEISFKHTSKISSQKHDNYKKTEFCKLCRRNGHLTEKCFRNPNGNNITKPTSNTNYRSINSFSSIPCAYCKKHGHHIKECFLKKRSDEYKDRLNTPNTSGNSIGFSKLERGTPSKVQDLTSVSKSNTRQT